MATVAGGRELKRREEDEDGRELKRARVGEAGYREPTGRFPWPPRQLASGCEVIYPETSAGEPPPGLRASLLAGGALGAGLQGSLAPTRMLTGACVGLLLAVLVWLAAVYLLVLLLLQGSEPAVLAKLTLEDRTDHPALDGAETCASGRGGDVPCGV